MSSTRNCRLYSGEMAMSGFVLAAAFYGVFTVNRWTFSIFLFLQVCACSQDSSLLSGWWSGGLTGAFSVAFCHRVCFCWCPSYHCTWQG